MTISIITLFPQMFEQVIFSSILKRAQEKKIVSIDLIDLRDFGIGKHKSVDDAPYGGGAGMVLKVDVLHAAIQSAKKKHKKAMVILLDPKGTPFSQSIAENLSTVKNIILVCGHYEGFDERIRKYIDMEISMGDFVLTGGEIPAMAVIDSVVRLIPGALGKDESSLFESFSKSESGRILEGPHYTRPNKYKGKSVPEVLLSGDPKKVAKYRHEMGAELTKKKRRDLVS